MLLYILLQIYNLRGADMFGQRRQRTTFFTPRVTDITPQPVMEEQHVTFEDEYEDEPHPYGGVRGAEPMVIAPPKSKKNRLPGVRLLRQLQKARQQSARRIATGQAELQGKMRDLKI